MTTVEKKRRRERISLSKIDNGEQKNTERVIQLKTVYKTSGKVNSSQVEN
jgi:hypothetical protein